MKKIVGLAAVAALVLAACTSAPTATETGIPTPVSTEQQFPDDLIAAPGTDVCDSSQPWQGKPAGTLIKMAEVPGDGAEAVGGKTYRVLYTSILGDESQIVPVCGTAVVPADKAVTHVLNWAHGTVGLTLNCVPFRTKEGLNKDFHGGGLGALAAKDKKNPDPSFNGLRTLLGAGIAVLATDYYSGLTGKLQPYAAGIAEGAQVLDLMRAFYPQGATFVTWGHSQGGGSALWASQIASKYLPSNYVQKAVVAAAPATQFVATPNAPGDLVGRHLGDRDAYNYIDQIVPIGNVLFSFVMQSWTELSKANPQGPWASLPPGKPLNIRDALTSEGVTASTTIANKVCLNDGPLNLISNLVTAVAPFTATLNKPAKPFFTKPFQGVFVDKAPMTSQSAIDKSCLNPPKPSTISGVTDVKAWCAALQWNLPGPNGTNPNVDKLPPADVPMLVTQGTSDNVVWCFKPGSTNPPAVDCLAKQYVDSVAAAGKTNVDSRYYAGEDHFGVMPASAKDSIAFILQALGA